MGAQRANARPARRFYQLAHKRRAQLRHHEEVHADAQKNETRGELVDSSRPSTGAHGSDAVGKGIGEPEVLRARLLHAVFRRLRSS